MRAVCAVHRIEWHSKVILVGQHGRFGGGSALIRCVDNVGPILYNVHVLFNRYITTCIPLVLEISIILIVAIITLDYIISGVDTRGPESIDTHTHTFHLESATKDHLRLLLPGRSESLIL